MSEITVKSDKNVFKYIVNQKIFLGTSIILFLWLIPHAIYIIHNRSLTPTPYRLSTQLFLGAWSSIIASLFFSWVIYLYRDEIRRIFVLRDLVTIRVPLMIGSAPLFVSQKFGFFDDSKINVNLDFRYAGISTLEDLKDGLCDIAVASDIAIAAFLEDSKNLYFRIYSLPFVKIRDNIKILVKKNSSITSISGLAGKKLAYIKDSVHEHYINKIIITDLGINCITVPKRTNIECFKEVYDDNAEACIFWEPHYLSMQNNFDLVELPVVNPYEWFLCLVTTQQYYSKRKGVHKNIFDALKKSVVKCDNDSMEVVRDCFSYMLPEFTGVNQDLLQSILIPVKKHTYKIDETINNEYKSKLALLHQEGHYRGSTRAMGEDLWPECN